MWLDQAIYTSINRDGRSGYHLVAWSEGLVEAEARRIAAWSPTEDGLLTDAHDPASVNFLPLDGGRFMLARSCAGPPEYSGRGGAQVYTHAVVFDRELLERAGRNPLPLYRAVAALGALRFRPDPPTRLDRLELQGAFPTLTPHDGLARLEREGVPGLLALRDRLARGESLIWPHERGRTALIDSLIGSLPFESRLDLSFTTALRPSLARPVRLALVRPE